MCNKYWMSRPFSLDSKEKQHSHGRAPTKVRSDPKSVTRLFTFGKKDTGGIALHIVASVENADDVLDLLSDRSEQFCDAQCYFGLTTNMEKAKDELGFAPTDYACQRGNNYSIQLVQSEISNGARKSYLILAVASPLPKVTILSNYQE